MKFISLLFIASVSLCGQAFAGPDDTKWINQCVTDNAKQGQSAAVIKSYCTCMNNKMSDNETQSISQWEKTHKKENEACSAEAGWK